MDQRTDEWAAARLGHVGCSRLSDVLAQGRGGAPSATRRNYMAELLCERLTGKAAEHFITAEMLWGIDNEPLARSAYEARYDLFVTEDGGREHDTIKEWWGSPDFLVGEEGGGEIKCLTTANHLDVLLSGNVDRKYILQITGYMILYNREWWDYVGFDPRLSGKVSLFVKRFYRKDMPVAEVEDGVVKFLAELEELERKVRAINQKEEPDATSSF